MPQSLSTVYIHLVFSTKERRPFLRDKSLRESLHAYLGSVSKQLEVEWILRRRSQGSSFLATLGFAAKSRWDLKRVMVRRLHGLHGERGELIGLIRRKGLPFVLVLVLVLVG